MLCWCLSTMESHNRSRCIFVCFCVYAKVNNAHRHYNSLYMNEGEKMYPPANKHRLFKYSSDKSKQTNQKLSKERIRKAKFFLSPHTTMYIVYPIQITISIFQYSLFVLCCKVYCLACYLFSSDILHRCFC